MTSLAISGFCPMGCGWTLRIDEDGDVTCIGEDCPRPAAVAVILADEETEHTVRFLPSSFTVRHPLRERLDDALMDCELGAYLASLDGPPVAPGTYRAIPDGDSWTFEAGADT